MAAPQKIAQKKEPPAKPVGLAISIDESISISPVLFPSVYNETPKLLDEIRNLPLTGKPDKLKAAEDFIRDFLKENSKHLDQVASLAISSIGLVDMKERRIERIVRPGWPKPDTIWPWDFHQLIQEADASLGDIIRTPPFGPSSRFTIINDATAGAIGEFWHIKRSCGREDVQAVLNRPLVYVRVGEGINAGIVVRGTPWRGGLHPELGHMSPRPHPDDIAWAYPEKGGKGHRVCTVHDGCYEGLASREALRQRWGTDVIAGNDKALEMQAYYIAQLCQTATLMLAPGRIVLGGSLVNDDMLDRVRRKFYVLLSSYPRYAELDQRSRFLMRAGLMRSNLTGAAHLAHSMALGRERAAPRF